MKKKANENNQIDRIPGGGIIIARQIEDSEIWLDKPPQWLKIWIHIIIATGHKNNPSFERGEGFFNFSRLLREGLLGPGITRNQIVNFLDFARREAMITTTKTTRGIVIKVLKYDFYQTLDNYIAASETTNKDTTKPQRNHNETTTINKNDKYDKNDKNMDTTYPSAPTGTDSLDPEKIKRERSPIEQLFDVFYFTINPTINFGNKTMRKDATHVLEKYGLVKSLEMAKYAISVRDEPYAPMVRSPSDLCNKFTTILDFYERSKIPTKPKFNINRC